MPTRIAFCITELDPGGAERALVRIACGLDRDDWQPLVICLGPDAELVQPLRDAGVEVVCLNATSKRDFGLLFRLRRELKRFRPQVLQTFLFHANVLGRIAAKLAGVPHVVSGIRVAERRSKWPLRIDRWTQFLVDRHVCVSQSVAEFSAAEAGLDAAKLMTIYNGVEYTSLASALPCDLTQHGVPAGAKVVLFVGRLDPQKAPGNLVKAMTTVVKAHESAHAVFVGDGVLADELQQLTTDLQLADRVHFVGQQSNVGSFYKSADVLVLPSLWEGLPNVVLEAMAAGTAVIATDVDGTCEVVEDGVTGLLVLPGVVDPLATTINRVLGDPQLATTMCNAAQSVVAERFTWQHCIDSYCDLYHELLNR